MHRVRRLSLLLVIFTLGLFLGGASVPTLLMVFIPSAMILFMMYDEASYKISQKHRQNKQMVRRMK